MASAALSKTQIFSKNPTRKPFQNRSRTRITFETLFFRIYVNLVQKWEPRLGPDFQENRSGKGKDLRTRTGKGKGREGKGKEWFGTFCVGGGGVYPSLRGKPPRGLWTHPFLVGGWPVFAIHLFFGRSFLGSIFGGAG